VLDRPVRVVGTPESAAHGAAILAATGAGAFGTVPEACAAVVEVGPEVGPSSASAQYDEVYSVYRDLYPALREPFHRLSGFAG
jgi:xylulokinase